MLKTRKDNKIYTSRRTQCTTTCLFFRVGSTSRFCPQTSSHFNPIFNLFLI